MVVQSYLILLFIEDIFNIILGYFLGQKLKYFKTPTTDIEIFIGESKLLVHNLFT